MTPLLRQTKIVIHIFQVTITYLEIMDAIMILRHISGYFMSQMRTKNQLKLLRNLGTNFYNVGLPTKGGILLHPGKLVRAMIDVLPSNVKLLENSSLIKWNKTNR